MQSLKTFFPNQLMPSGWLYDQLKIQADGLCGNLDKVWNDVKNSSWIGGNCEGWERVPYWLDGFIPLAYLLNDSDMIKRAKFYIDAIISRQNEDGWICPCELNERANYDTWAVLLISKVLTVYYQCSKDSRIPTVLYNAMKNYYELLKSEKIKLFDWGKYRWFEGFIALDFLFETYNENWILQLAQILKNQGLDYKTVTNLWERPLNKWTLGTHIVNICMALKAEALVCKLLKTDYLDEAESLLKILDKYNGTPVGIFTGDECLSGLSPIQGTELCAVVEQIYSYQILYALTGDNKWAERLEMVAFNALPATLSDDTWAHQYVQMSNQIACQKFPGKSLFRTNGSEAHLFGLEPNYGCCTANFNQGWPKFALSSFVYDDNKVVSAIPLPTKLTTNAYQIEVISEYPFKNNFKYLIKANQPFNFEIRIPAFANNVKVNGKHVQTNGNLAFEIKKGETQIEIDFQTQVEIIERPHNLNAIKYGSLIFSVPIDYKAVKIEYEKDGVVRKYPYCDYEYIPLSSWNYALTKSDFIVERRQISKIPFNSKAPAIVLKGKVCQIDWGYEDGYDTVCAKIPQSTAPISEEKEIEFYPYGCAKLRMTEIPFAKTNIKN